MQYFDVFSSEYISQTPVTGIVRPSDLNYLRRLYTFNRDMIVKYYQERNFVVKNTHILSRLLEHFPTYIEYDSYRYLEISDNKTKYLAKHFKFTSEIEKGVVHPDHFFGNGGEEIIIASHANFDIKQTELLWRQAKSIQILKHNRNDTRLLLPLGTDDESRSGLSSILINIPKLSLQYREFVKEQHTKSLEEGTLLNKNYFVIKYVLPNTIEDIVDHMFLNKVMDKFYGLEEVVPKYKHRFKLFEPTTQIDRYVDQTLDVITNKNLDFINIMHNIQLMFNIDASELLGIEDVSFTRQIRWSIIASRLQYMIFLYDVSKNKNMNKHHINDWKRLIQRTERDNIMSDMFSYEIEQDIKEKMYKIKNM